MSSKKRRWGMDGDVNNEFCEVSMSGCVSCWGENKEILFILFPSAEFDECEKVNGFDWEGKRLVRKSFSSSVLISRDTPFFIACMYLLRRNFICEWIESDEYEELLDIGWMVFSFSG